LGHALSVNAVLEGSRKRVAVRAHQTACGFSRPRLR